MKKGIYFLLFLFTLIGNAFAADNKLIKYSEICNENWTQRYIENGKLILNAPAQKFPNIKRVCTSVLNNSINRNEIEELLVLVNTGNITAWFVMGYYVFEHDNTPTKEREIALGLLQQSAFWANPYAHAYLHELYSSKKHGVYNQIQAALSLAHFQSYTDIHNLTISSSGTTNP